MSLDHDDVQALLKLLDDSPYNELTLQTDAFTLHLQRTADGKHWQQHAQVATRAESAQTLAIVETSKVTEPVATEAGLREVRAPMVGTWYRAPAPGAEPFIKIDSVVNDNTVIGIIEAMKLMCSVPAKQNGTVVEILVEDGTLVSIGQLLARVRPPA